MACNQAEMATCTKCSELGGFDGSKLLTGAVLIVPLWWHQKQVTAKQGQHSPH
jgi:hypothetical protein